MFCLGFLKDHAFLILIFYLFFSSVFEASVEKVHRLKYGTQTTGLCFPYSNRMSSSFTLFNQDSLSIRMSRSISEASICLIHFSFVYDSLSRQRKCTTYALLLMLGSLLLNMFSVCIKKLFVFLNQEKRLVTRRLQSEVKKNRQNYDSQTYKTFCLLRMEV